MIICMHTVILVQEFLSYTYNLRWDIWLIDRFVTGTTILVSEVMIRRSNCTFSRSPEVELHRWLQIIPGIQVLGERNSLPCRGFRRMHKFGVVRFHFVLWHINQCRWFNAKSSFYKYINYKRFSLVWFYDISTIVGYSMKNLLYTYILNIWFLNTFWI